MLLDSLSIPILLLVLDHLTDQTTAAAAAAAAAAADDDEALTHLSNDAVLGARRAAAERGRC